MWCPTMWVLGSKLIRSLPATERPTGQQTKTKVEFPTLTVRQEALPACFPHPAWAARSLSREQTRAAQQVSRARP